MQWLIVVTLVFSFPACAGAEQEAEPSPRPAGLAAAVDRTFTEDFVWRGTIGGEIIVWNMIGPEYLGYQSLPTVPLAWAIQAVADFDQDGATDFVWRNTATNETYFWLMEGDSEVVRQGLALEPAVLDGNWQIAAAADMDRDGSTDLIWRNNSSGQNLVWFMDGTSFRSWAPLASVPDLGWRLRGAGQVDNDAAPDLVWRRDSGEVVVWFMGGEDGTQLLRHASLPTVAPTWSLSAVGDIDADGYADLIWRNGVGTETIAWFMRGEVLDAWAEVGPRVGAGWSLVATRRRSIEGTLWTPRRGTECSTRFSDTGAHPLAPYIDSLASRCLVAGFPDGTFRPDENLTRAEFAAMLMRVLDPPDTRTCAPFPDVPRGAWYAEVVQRACRSGFMQGDPEGTFRPNHFMTRTEAIAALVTAVSLAHDAAQAGAGAPGARERHPFDGWYLSLHLSDANVVPPWAHGHVAAALSLGLVVSWPGSGTQFWPLAPVTRSWMAAVVYRAGMARRRFTEDISQYVVKPTFEVHRPTFVYYAGGNVPDPLLSRCSQGYVNNTKEPLALIVSSVTASFKSGQYFSVLIPLAPGETWRKDQWGPWPSGDPARSIFDLDAIIRPDGTGVKYAGAVCLAQNKSASEMQTEFAAFIEPARFFFQHQTRAR
jgi:ketosteroid isomerase-like protein